MEKKDILQIINQLERKVEKSKYLLYERTDTIINRLENTDNQETIESCYKQVAFIYQAFDKYLETLIIE